MKKYLLAFMVIFSLSACQKNLLKTVPNDRLSDEIFWKTEQDVIFAANAVYSFLETAEDFTNWDAMSDNGHVTLQWREESAIEKNTYESTLAKIKSVWDNNYKGIRAANVFLDNAPGVKHIDANLLKRLTGEVKFLRAFFYTRLAQLYGDVPLITKEITLAESRNVKRNPVSEIWDFISNELQAAASDLPLTQSEKGRVTKGAALALKARAMLHANRFKDSWQAAEEVIGLNVYQLYSSYENLFSYGAEGNSEIIFDRQFVKNVQSNNVFFLTTPNGVLAKANSFVPVKSLVDEYEMRNGKTIQEAGSGFDPRNPYRNRDPRLGYTIYTLGSILINDKVYDPRPGSGTADAIGYSENSTPTGFNSRKYLNKEDMATPTNSGINLIFIRYAEVLLTYAEAKVSDNIIDASVFDAINTVRNRPDVGMPPISMRLAKDELIKSIRRERRVELAFEGLRYFDLRRTKEAEMRIPGTIKGMTYENNEGSLVTVEITGFVKAFNPARDYLWPIPKREIELNPNLTQNPNW